MSGGANDENRGFNAAQNLGANLVTDLGSNYNKLKKAPPTFNKSLWTDLTPQTHGLIGQGIGDNAAMRAGPIGQVAQGQWLGGGNPYFEGILSKTKDNVTSDVNRNFSSMGLWGSDLHAEGLAEGLGNAELGARYGNFTDEWNRMGQALGMQGQGTAQALGYSSLLDTNEQAKRQGEYDLHERTSDPQFALIDRYLASLTRSQTTPGVQEKTPWWQSMLGAGMNLAGNAIGAFF